MTNNVTACLSDGAAIAVLSFFYHVGSRKNQKLLKFQIDLQEIKMMIARAALQPARMAP